MVTIIRNPSGFHVVKARPNWRAFNAPDYPNNVLVTISDWRRLGERTQHSKLWLWLWLHADNARPHPAKVSTDDVTRNEMKRAPHPPYSPDLAPPDFFLLGSVRRKLMGHRAESEWELLVRNRVI
jgi:hypothetical protein